MNSPDHYWWMYESGNVLSHTFFWKPENVAGLLVLEAKWFCIICGDFGITMYAPNEDPSGRKPDKPWMPSCQAQHVKRLRRIEDEHERVVIYVLES